MEDSLSAMDASYLDSKMMLKDTLNVKLRYEMIIQNLIENEKQGG